MRHADFRLVDEFSAEHVAGGIMHGVDEVLMRDCKLLIRPCRNDTVYGQFFDRDCRCVGFKEVYGGNGGYVDVLKLNIFCYGVEF